MFKPFIGEPEDVEANINYDCTCKEEGMRLGWRPSTACLYSNPAAVVAKNEPCRITRPSGAVWFGETNSYPKPDVCKFFPVPWGKNNATVREVSGVGGPDENGLKMDILCRIRE